MGICFFYIEIYLKKEKFWKYFIFVFNKCDFVLIWVIKWWVVVFFQDYLIFVFYVSFINLFGKGVFIQFLWQFGKLYIDKKQISVGFIGYLNVGKSFVINILCFKKVCNVVFIVGEIKVWQYIILMCWIFLIDCLGVVYFFEDFEIDIVLKGVV